MVHLNTAPKTWKRKERKGRQGGVPGDYRRSN